MQFKVVLLLFIAICLFEKVNSFSFSLRQHTGAARRVRSRHVLSAVKEPRKIELPITSAKQYLSKEDRPYLIGNRPDSGLNLGLSNFKKELKGILADVKARTVDKLIKVDEGFPEILKFRLSNEAVKQAELDRERLGDRVDAHPISRTLYNVGCLFLDTFFDERPLARFWFLETVARIPYFVYVSMLHLYETLGWWREPSLRKIHDAEEWNELHHLLIMETLGADKRWSDRFLGYHAAILYYWLLIATYIYSPKIAYQFMELLEAHAVDTYGTFVIENEARLKALPPPDIAVTYYTGKDLYQFDEFQAGRDPGSRRPPCDNMYDVFCNIRDDECEHVRTMKACQEYTDKGIPVISPHDRSTYLNSIDNKLEKREQWKEWATAVNEEGKQD